MNASDKKDFKKLFKEAFAETSHENRDLLHEVVIEALEDMALSEAIKEGLVSEKIDRDEVFELLNASS